MMALALALTVLAAPPRGFAAAHSIELVTQVDTRLSKWLTLGGDRKALLADPKELERSLLTGGVKPADLKDRVAAAVTEQSAPAALQQFTATRAIIEYAGKAATVSFFDEGAHRCEVPLFAVGTDAAPRYVLLGGPRTDALTFESLVEKGRTTQAMHVFLEKQNGAWSTVPAPKPPALDCTAVLTKALKSIFVAEKAYFAEHDSYSPSLSKVGVDPTTLGVNSAKVSVAGSAPAQTFSIQVGREGGLMKMDDKGETTVIAPCSH